MDQLSLSKIKTIFLITLYGFAGYMTIFMTNFVVGDSHKVESFSEINIIWAIVLLFIGALIWGFCYKVSFKIIAALEKLKL